MAVRRLLPCCLVAAALFAAGARPAPPRPPADARAKGELVDVQGGEYRLPGPADCKAVVLVFVGHDCPISNSYSKEIVRLGKEFVPKQVAFCVVYADADVRRDDARKHAREYGFNCPAVLDPKMTLALRVGATIKPEAAVLSPRGEVLYLGRIDDRYVDFGKRREHVTSHELRDALDAVLAGRPVATPRRKGVGCDIDFPRTAK